MPNNNIFIRQYFTDFLLKWWKMLYDNIFLHHHHPDLSPDPAARVTQTHSGPWLPGDQVMMSLVWAGHWRPGGESDVSGHVCVVQSCPGPQLRPHPAAGKQLVAEIGCGQTGWVTSSPGPGYWLLTSSWAAVENLGRTCNLPSPSDRRVVECTAGFMLCLHLGVLQIECWTNQSRWDMSKQSFHNC